MWYTPTTLQEALELLAAEQPRMIAGGTDLMVKHRVHQGVAPALGSAVMALHRVKELRGHRVLGIDGPVLYDRVLEIGAATTLAGVVEIPELPPILHEAILSVAAPATRNIATLGGNICNASPAADSVPALAVLGASVVVQSLRGTREVPVEDFITGPGKTVLEADELVTTICVPLRPRAKGYFRKVGTRKANALTKVSFTGLVEFADAPDATHAVEPCAGAVNKVAGTDSVADATHATGVTQRPITYCAVAFGSVGPKVVVIPSHMNPFVTHNPEQIAQIREEVVASIMKRVTPIDDQRSTAAYRKQVAKNILNYFIDHYVIWQSNRNN